jgi:hypothetical protein
MVPGLGDNILEMKSHANRVSDDLAWDPLKLSHSDPTAGWQPAIFLVAPSTTARRPSALAASATAEVPVKTFDGGDAGSATLNLKVTKGEKDMYVVHRKYVLERRNARAGTASTKTRSEVRGGGRKPFKQKGTGRARQGSIRSPLKVGGGVMFGPKPKNWANKKMNRKEAELAIGIAIQNKASRNAASLIELEVCDFISKILSPRPGTIFSDMSETSAPLLASMVAGRNPLCMRTPSIITNANNPAPTAYSVMGVLLPFGSSFCAAFSFSLIAFAGCPLADVSAIASCCCGSGCKSLNV